MTTHEPQLAFRNEVANNMFLANNAHFNTSRLVLIPKEVFSSSINWGRRNGRDTGCLQLIFWILYYECFRDIFYVYAIVNVFVFVILAVLAWH